MRCAVVRACVCVCRMLYINAKIDGQNVRAFCKQRSLCCHGIFRLLFMIWPFLRDADVLLPRYRERRWYAHIFGTV